MIWTDDSMGDKPLDPPKVNRFYTGRQSLKAQRNLEARTRAVVRNRADWRRVAKLTRKVFRMPYERPAGSYGFRFRMR